MMRVAGIVLCGGRSSRMGRPKAWLPFGDELLLPRVVRLLGEVVSPVVVVAAPDQDVPLLQADIQIVRDEAAFLGPLNGLAAGLTALQGRVDAAYLSACDVPFLKAAFVRRVIEGLENADVCLPEFGGYRHPLAAVYRLSVLPTARRLLSENRLRPAFVADEHPTVVLSERELREVDPEMASTRNLNTEDEYRAALADLGREAGRP